MTINGRSPERLALLVGLVVLTFVPLLAQEGQWLMYSGSYSSHRFSPLKQITTDNVAKLRPVWVYPSLQGSTNWASPSYSPVTDMLYVPVREMGSVYYKTGVEYKPGTYYTGGSEKRLDEESWGAVHALDVKTGKQAWDFTLPTPTWAGVMATAGGLVFSGSNEGNFYALDAKSGKPLWQFQTGGAIRSGQMSFLAGDKQYVAVAGGHALFVFALGE
jgi:alcohol dehydrogenase (cytochrome c)